MEYQNGELSGDPYLAAGELMTRVEEAVKSASERFNATVEHHGARAVSLETALESLKIIEQNAAWATRMLVEIAGRHRKMNNRPRNTLSMRRVAEVSGVSLASVHSWVNHPAQVLDDGHSGPGTLPRPGQTSHHFTKGTSYFRDGDDGTDVDESSP